MRKKRFLANTEARSQTDVFVREKVRLEKLTSDGEGEFCWRRSVKFAQGTRERRKCQRRNRDKAQMEQNFVVALKFLDTQMDYEGKNFLWLTLKMAIYYHLMLIKC